MLTNEPVEHVGGAGGRILQATDADRQLGQGLDQGGPAHRATTLHIRRSSC